MNVIGGILAGGYGKRLLPLTKTYPKQLIEIKENYTILDKQLNDLRFADIKNVYLMVGYLYEKIIERYGHKWKDLNLTYLIEDKPQGTLFAIRNALEHSNRDMIIMNGDIICDFNLKKMIEIARKRKELITIAITKMPSPYGIVVIEENKIVNFIEKPLLPHYINAGIYYIKKEAIDLFKRDYASTDVERTVFPKAAVEGELAYYTEDVFWHSIDSVKDVELIRDFYKNREDKPWGWERTLVSNEKYLVKELYIKAGYRTSIHYHKERDETLNVIRGLGYLEIFDNDLNLIKKEFLATNSIVRIRPNTIHSIVAEDSLLLQEYSTPYPNDVVRLKDFYLR